MDDFFTYYSKFKHEIITKTFEYNVGYSIINIFQTLNLADSTCYSIFSEFIELSKHRIFAKIDLLCRIKDIFLQKSLIEEYIAAIKKTWSPLHYNT